MIILPPYFFHRTSSESLAATLSTHPHLVLGNAVPVYVMQIFREAQPADQPLSPPPATMSPRSSLDQYSVSLAGLKFKIGVQARVHHGTIVLNFSPLK